MKILITGGAGMVGRNIIEHSKMAQFELLAPSRSELDLSDFVAVNRWLHVHRPDMVIHAAGTVGGIHANVRAPARFLVENFDVGRNVVMAARENGITRLVNLGSSCMYPYTAANPLRETSILAGLLEPTNEGYALAKIAVAKLCEYISNEESSLSYKTVIPCNIYGRHDSFDKERSHLVPAIIEKIHAAKKSGAGVVEIWGDGEARREFMYAGDLADAIYFAVSEFETMPSLMNIGLGADHSINEYYKIIAEIIGFEGEFVHNLDKPVGMKQKLVCTELQEKWGWAAAHTLTSGLEKTYDFYLRSQC
jgi:GDP-L-fucose synthase